MMPSRVEGRYYDIVSNALERFFLPSHFFVLVDEPVSLQYYGMFCELRDGTVKKADPVLLHGTIIDIAEELVRNHDARPLICEVRRAAELSALCRTSHYGDHGWVVQLRHGSLCVYATSPLNKTPPEAASALLNELVATMMIGKGVLPQELPIVFRHKGQIHEGLYSLDDSLTYDGELHTYQGDLTALVEHHMRPGELGTIALDSYVYSNLQIPLKMQTKKGVLMACDQGMLEGYIIDVARYL
jgi:hypothetical protein